LKRCPETHGAAVGFFYGLRQSVVRRVTGSVFGDGDEHVEFQGDGGSDGLSATQTDMTTLHALDHICQSVNGSTDRTARAGIGQFLTLAAIAQFMASMFEGGPRHARLLDPGAGRGWGRSQLINLSCEQGGGCRCYCCVIPFILYIHVHYEEGF